MSDLSNFRSRRDLSTLVNNPEPEVQRNLNADIWRVFESQHNVEQSSGETFQVIVQPDCRFPLMAWIYSVTSAFSSTSFRDDAYASPPSIIAYTLVMYYAMMYFTDIYLAPFPTDEAQRLYNERNFQIFFDNLLALPVPDFADEFFLKLQPFQDSLAKNLHFVSSLGTEDPAYDFGTIFPAVSFFQLHNILATSSANAPLTDLLRTFYTQTVCTFGNRPYTNGQLFGAIRLDHGGNSHRYHNWMNQRLELLISNAAIRTTMSRAAYGSFNIQAPVFRDQQHYSVYDFTMGLSLTNLNQHMMLMNHIGPFIRENFPKSKNLANYISYGSPSIVRHLESGPFLPTWHTKEAPTAPETRLPVTIEQPNDFADWTRFMSTPPEPSESDTPRDRLETISTLDKYPNGAQRALVLFTKPGSSSSTIRAEEDPIDWTPFSLRDHYQPQMIIFDPADSNPAAHGITILGGHIIRKSELCGIGISLPYPHSNLLYVNTLYMEGAVTRQKCRTALTSALYASVPDPLDRTDTPLAFFLKTMKHIRIPLYRTGYVEASQSTTPQSHRFLPSFNFVKFTRRTDDSYNAVAGTTSEGPTIDNETIDLWSSYRVIVRHPKTLANEVFYLPTLRHIYGQRVRSMITHFPSLLIP